MGRWFLFLAIQTVLWATPPEGDVRPSTLVFVANAENLTEPRVHYPGRPWKVDPAGYLVGSGAGHRLLAESAPGSGDFRIELELILPRSGKTSSVLLGEGNSLDLLSGSATFSLRGRFFRAGDTPLALSVPTVPAGTPLRLEIERQGGAVFVRVNGTDCYRGLCSETALGHMGIDPGTGLVQLQSFQATGRFASSGLSERAFANPFGQQLRRPPDDLRRVRAPVIVREAPTNEASLVSRRDGSLELYSITKPESDSVSCIRSIDGGLTWSTGEIAFRLQGRAYYAIVVLEAADGAMQAVFHLQGQGPGGYRGRLYEVYHTRRPPDSTVWSDPRRIVPGYVGSINGFIQLEHSGRLVLAVARAVPEREAPPKNGEDRGWNDTFVYFSDDQGRTWRASEDRLSLVLPTPNSTRYGAIEPALLELRDRRIWMLVRDRGGFLWQTFSTDGEHWPALTVSPFISSDSPADLLRLRDGKILLLTNACQNWTDPRSYAMGGREVLHAAISDDEGRNWRGFREILHETLGTSGGDRGTSYASAAQNTAGKVVVVSGQGEGKRALLIFDPAWLEETALTDDLSEGPVNWNQYGDDGLHLVRTESNDLAVALPLKSTGLCGALWNFPAARKGSLHFRLWAPGAVRRLSFSLTDHFNRIDDLKATEHAVFTAPWMQAEGTSDGRWHDVSLRWTNTLDSAATLELTIDGELASRFSARRTATFGVNYLRIEFRGSIDQGGVMLSRLSMTTLP